MRRARPDRARETPARHRIGAPPPSGVISQGPQRSAFDVDELLDRVVNDELLAQEAWVLEMQDDVDLVMMGTHGRTGLSRVILGNVARTVAGEAHVPVVTMRSAERQWLM